MGGGFDTTASLLQGRPSRPLAPVEVEVPVEVPYEVPYEVSSFPPFHVVPPSTPHIRCPPGTVLFNLTCTQRRLGGAERPLVDTRNTTC